MRVTQANDDIFDALVADGLVVVAFYTKGSGGFKDPENWAEQFPYPSPAIRDSRPNRLQVSRQSAFRRALRKAAWKHNRAFQVVFVEYETCRQACHRLRVFAFPTLLIFKDGVRLAEMHGLVTAGHPKSHDIALESFTEWFKEALPIS